MSDVALPSIVIDSQNLESGAAGTSVIDDTDGGHSARPRSATSSEGSLHEVCLQDFSTIPSMGSQ